MAENSDALIILTEWKEFAAMDLLRINSLLKYPIVIDGRNLYSPEAMADAGLMYHSIGRAAATPEHSSAAQIYGGVADAQLSSLAAQA